MSYIQEFLNIASEVFELFVSGWPVGMILLAVILLSLSYGSPLAPSHLRRKHLVLFVPLLFSAMILVVGTLTAHRPHPIWTSWVILLLFLIQPIISLIIAVGILEFRLFTVAVLAFEIWVGLICCFVAAVAADGMRL